jgi:hypothetical protein
MAAKKTPEAKTAENAPTRRGKSAAVAAVAAKDSRKLVRDSFTMPKSEYVAIDALKSRALGLGRQVKKSEILRAGLRALTSMSDRSLVSALNAVPTLKTGRPKGEAADASKEETTPGAKKTLKKVVRSASRQAARKRTKPAASDAPAPSAVA